MYNNNPIVNPLSPPVSEGNNSECVCLWKHCNRNFEDAESLYNHLSTDHVGRKSTGNLCLDCHWDDCDVRTTKRDHITSHLRVHVTLKPHICEVMYLYIIYIVYFLKLFLQKKILIYLILFSY
jgi:hypothetical protein